MKFNKQINNGTLLIPGGAFKISGFEGGEKVEIHTLDSAVVVLKKQMTTMELIRRWMPCTGWPRSSPSIWPESVAPVMTARMAAHSMIWRTACWNCQTTCGKKPASLPGPSSVSMWMTKKKTVTIAEAGYDHDLRDVPPYLLEMLGEAGICLGELEEQLMVGNLIYGEHRMQWAGGTRR